MATTPIHFTHCSLKTLTAVEADTNRSNQHEFQGVAPLRAIFGQQRLSCQAKFSLRGNGQLHDANLTWYDSRENQPHRSSEFRLYFQSNPVMDIAKEGDNILIGLDSRGGIHCELIPQGSTSYTYSAKWN